MTDKPVVVVGFVTPVMAALVEFQPPGSVILVEEPDVVRKRDVRGKLAGSTVLRELIEWEYCVVGRADEFYNAHPDLDPAAVVPLLEYATPFAARLAERYGLPGASLGAANIMRDKALLRQVTAAAGVRNPEMAPAHSPADVLSFMRQHPGPVVLKPANRQASVGTQVIYDPNDVLRAWLACVAQDEGILVPDRAVELRMLVERYVAGDEYSVEMLVQRGKPVFANVTAKQLFPGSRPVELAHLVPADIPPALTATLGAQTARVVDVTGFRDGIVHCEWIVADGVPHLVECAGRCPGDGIMEIIERAYPVPLLRTYFEIMKGRQPSAPMPSKARGGAAVRFVAVEPGTVDSINGVEAAREAPGVFLADVMVAAGHKVTGLRSSWDRAAIVMATGGSAAEALRRAEVAAEMIDIDVQPQRSVADAAR
ncbi:ATP-grasp domain-containing protein [Kutzneria buriramensis]|uniref:Biotin carboxylase n=1 Tax=Kutzneria buriramensis TaxID=1045776 RepID=A0A3E0HI35_9PSEU|nr:ATP-grasp domain-containing protein [Kutzneria buriramensis]REH46020.1 biotin carboxylase [Kutzneria buriramensis]